VSLADRRQGGRKFRASKADSNSIIIVAHLTEQKEEFLWIPQETMAERLQNLTSRVGQAVGLMSDSPTYTFPDFDDMPPVPNMPQGNAWGFFDKDGKKDEIGSKLCQLQLRMAIQITCVLRLTALNLLTPAVVLEASKEIKTGRRVQLDWSLDNVNFPSIGRKQFEHKIVDLAPHGFVALDDEIHMNTQSGSQWDSLKHACTLWPMLRQET
jgi:hypothetical protein